LLRFIKNGDSFSLFFANKNAIKVVLCNGRGLMIIEGKKRGYIGEEEERENCNCGRKIRSLGEN